MKKHFAITDDFMDPVYAVKVLGGHHVLCQGWIMQVLSPLSCTVEWSYGGRRHRTREYFHDIWRSPGSVIQHYVKDLRTKLQLQAEDFYETQPVEEL